MRSRTWAAASLLLASVYALPELAIEKRDRHNGGRTRDLARSVHAHEKRQGTVETNIFDVLSWSFGGAYYCNLTVGTPPQLQTLIVDTGSSDLYFDASTAKTCQLPESNAESCQGGTFDPSKSSSYNEVHAAPAFNTSFGDGSTAVGPYGSDLVGIGDIRVSPVQFGVAQEVDTTTGFSIGLIGLGYSVNEAVTQLKYVYPNMPEVLKDAGVINSRLYSMYLNTATATSGTVLFGGIDRSKYTGDLVTVDFIPGFYGGQNPDIIYQFVTTVTAANVTTGGQTTNLWSGGSPGIGAYGQNDPSLPVLLDTGSTAWSVPEYYYYQFIAPAFNYVDRNGICSCEYANSGDSLSLEFAGAVTINVDASEFIVPIVNSTTKEPVSYDGKNNACAFLIQPEQQGPNSEFLTLGDAILRSMYIVFDLDNAQASIAQAKVNSTGEPDVVTVQAGPTGVQAAVSNVVTAPANTWTIAPAVSGESGAFSASTAQSTIGSATGIGAVPEDAQVSGGSGTGSGSAGSSGAAVGLVIPGADFTCFWITSIWVAGISLGFGLMM